MGTGFRSTTGVPPLFGTQNCKIDNPPLFFFCIFLFSSYFRLLQDKREARRGRTNLDVGMPISLCGRRTKTKKKVCTSSRKNPQHRNQLGLNKMGGPRPTRPPGPLRGGNRMVSWRAQRGLTGVNRASVGSVSDSWSLFPPHRNTLGADRQRLGLEVVCIFTVAGVKKEVVTMTTSTSILRHTSRLLLGLLSRLRVRTR